MHHDMAGTRRHLRIWAIRRVAPGDVGLSAGLSLIGIAVSLLLVLVLGLLASGAFSSSGSNGTPSVMSTSSAEEQLKLCVEGRPSTYGDPPTQAQQAACTQQLAAQIGGAPLDTATLPTSTSTIPALGDLGN